MAHNLLNEKFYSLRTPAWHGLGEIGQQEERVLDVAARMEIPHIALRDIAIPLRNGTFHSADGYKAIVGCVKEAGGLYSHSADGPAHGVQYNLYTYGIVTDSYHVLPHLSGSEGFLNIWQEVINAPCETLGVLGKGEAIFTTVKLPAFGVKGDEVVPYLLGNNTCDGKTAIRCAITPVRTVCQNTLMMGLAAATDMLVVNHTANPAGRVKDWLAAVWQRASEKVAIMREAMEVLAGVQTINNISVPGIFSEVYPLSEKPETDNLDKLAEWERGNKSQMIHQEACLQIFEGSATITSATRGTLWGAYNAVVEHEDFGKARRSARSRIFGEGAARKKKAFDVCMRLV